MKSSKSISRRDFLKVALVGAGAATLTACGAPTTEAPKPTDAAKPTDKPMDTPIPTNTPAPTAVPVVEVEITTSGWPVDVKTQEDIEADPANAAYAASVQTWLDANPGAKLTKLDVNIWDPSGIQAMVVGGTDVTFLFGPCVGGGWGRSEAVNAFIQGLLADITPEIARQNLEGKVLPHLWKAWSVNSQVDGKFFAYPLNEYAPGAALIIRRDLFAAAGGVPQIGWSWEEAAAAFKAVKANGVYGAGFPTWFLPYTCAMHGWDILTQIPVPDQPWHWTRDLMDPRWPEVIDMYRTMLFKDESILSKVELGGGDTEYLKLFLDGQIAAGRFNYWSMHGSPTDPTSYAAFADRMGKPYSEVFSVVSLPSGDGFQLGGGVDLWGPVSYSPNSDDAQLEKAVSLTDWMFFDKGLDMIKAANWEKFQDARVVWSAYLYMNGKTSYEGVPVGPADAWGQEEIDRWIALGQFPLMPQPAEFYPGEQNPAPNNTPIDDQLNVMVTDPADMDVAAMLAKAETDWKAAAAGFASSVDGATFKDASKKYFAALDEFFKKNYPAFYENRFKAFYEGKVLPNLA